MTKEDVLERLVKNGFSVINEVRNNNDSGYKLTLSNKAIVNVFDTGTVNVQGKNTESVQPLFLEDVNSVPMLKNNKVFVVYGHDDITKTQLEAMLRRWNLEPIILNQLPAAGNTVIEQLEEYTQQVEFGIVLATPDDMGYAVEDGADKAKYRVRQNVVLELGMLISKIGREKVAILLKDKENFEKPSDIAGLIYIQFSKTVEEAKLSLAKEMKKQNYDIKLEKI